MLLSYPGIYAIENTINNKLYVGSTTRLGWRRNKHWTALRHQQHHNPHLQAAFNLYGEESFRFTVLLVCESSELLRYEQGFVDLLKPEYNIMPPVERKKGWIVSEETKRKLREARSKSHYVYSEETRKRNSVAHKGKRLSEETCRKIGLAQRGKYVSEETRKKLSVSQKGRSFTPEHIANLRIARKKRNPFSMESRAKMSASQRKRVVSGKSLINIQNGQRQRRIQEQETNWWLRIGL